MMSTLQVGVLSQSERAMMQSIFTKVQRAKNSYIDSADSDMDEDLCMNKLYSLISTDMYSVIQNETTARGIWQSLESHCLGDAGGERMLLKSQFDGLQLKNNMSVEKFCVEWRNLISDMNQLGIKPSEFEQCTKIIDILPLATYQSFMN